MIAREEAPGARGKTIKLEQSIPSGHETEGKRSTGAMALDRFRPSQFRQHRKTGTGFPAHARQGANTGLERAFASLVAYEHHLVGVHTQRLMNGKAILLEDDDRSRNQRDQDDKLDTNKQLADQHRLADA